MKKNDQDKTIFNSDIGSTKHLEIDKIKTTNINILLNRVKLDQRRTLINRIVFLLILLALISFLIIYLNI